MSTVTNQRFYKIGESLKRICKQYESGTIKYNEVPNPDKDDGPNRNFWFEALEQIQDSAFKSKENQFERDLIHFEQTLIGLIAEFRKYKIRKEKFYT